MNLWPILDEFTTNLRGTFGEFLLIPTGSMTRDTASCRTGIDMRLKEVVGLLCAMAVMMPVIVASGAVARLPPPPPPSPPPPVYIYSVAIARDPTGATATATWNTVPSTSCDSFSDRVSGTTTWTTITLPCGTHTASLTGLTPGPRYDWSISSTASGYSTGTASGTFYNPDISSSYAFENYVVTYNYRNEDTITYYPKAWMTGDVMHNHATTNTASWTPHYFYYHIDSTSSQHNSGVRHITVTLTLYDDTQTLNSNDMWIFGNDVRPTTGSSLNTASVSYSFSQGIPGTGFSASWGMSCGIGNCVYNYAKGWPNTYQTDGGLQVGYADIEWNPEYTSSLDVTFQLAVMDVLAQHHYLDRLRFVANLQLTIDQIYTLFGTPIAWSNYQQYTQFTMFLGDRGDAPGQTDQYTDLQAGTEAINFW